MHPFKGVFNICPWESLTLASSNRKNHYKQRNIFVLYCLHHRIILIITNPNYVKVRFGFHHAQKEDLNISESDTITHKLADHLKNKESSLIIWLQRLCFTVWCLQPLTTCTTLILRVNEWKGLILGSSKTQVYKDSNVLNYKDIGCFVEPKSQETLKDQILCSSPEFSSVYLLSSPPKITFLCSSGTP